MSDTYVALVMGGCLFVIMIAVVVMILMPVTKKKKEFSRDDFPDYFPCQVEELLWDEHDWEEVNEVQICRRCGAEFHF